MGEETERFRESPRVPHVQPLGKCRGQDRRDNLARFRAASTLVYREKHQKLKIDDTFDTLYLSY